MSFSCNSALLDYLLRFLSCPLPFFSVPPWGSLHFPSLLWGFSLPGLSPCPWVLPRMVPSGFPLPVLVPAISFVLFFFSLVRPPLVPCFDLGPFLRFLVTGSSLVVASVVGGDLPGQFLFVPIPTLGVSFSNTVALFFPFSLSLFTCHSSSVPSFSRSFFFNFPSGCSVSF